MSAVVGPNGSGKSNVIDGLLFVFGRRAKQIRLKKLVHANTLMTLITIHRPNIMYCVVLMNRVN
jgi:AAA15 family ATPase/GTPase